MSRRRAADYVRPALGEARVTRMWSAIEGAEGALRKRRARRARLGALLAAAALITTLLLVVGSRLRTSPSPSSSSMAGLVIDTGAASQDVSLPEGSSLHLGPTTRLRIVTAAPGEIRLRLERGSVICDVTHREGRRFTVEAERVEVEVRGTKFEVDVDPGSGRPGAVAVRVERGAVEVREEGHALVATLKPGQAWESRALDDDARDDSETKAGSEPDPSSPPASARAAPPLPPLPTSNNPAPTRGAVLSPRALFERADAARLAGRHADAAAEFERFCRRFPGDPRAGLAAYELGRIRLGSLGDPRGAVEAFTIVLARDEGDPFREDAEAGRVEALDDLGDPVACKRARDAFRARYPSSPHAGRLARLCGAP